LPLLEKYDLELIDLIGELNMAAWKLSVLSKAGLDRLIVELEAHNVELSGDVRHRHEIIADLVTARKRIYDMEKVVEAARCIRHWHDNGTDGMVVSRSHVFALWEALKNLDEPPNVELTGSPEAGESELNDGLADAIKCCEHGFIGMDASFIFEPEIGCHPIVTVRFALNNWESRDAFVKYFANGCTT
jgi:hypothetical protein